VYSVHLADIKKYNDYTDRQTDRQSTDSL